MAARAKKAMVPNVPAPMPPVPVVPAALPPVEVAPNLGLCPGRLFEWVTAGMMIGVALIVSFSPKSIEFGGFYRMADIGLTSSVLALIFFAAGGIRVAALYANGGPRGWPIYGPRMRAVGALVGVIIWMQMLYALILWSTKNGYLSIGVSVYLFLVIGEGISCYRAASDVRSKPH